VGKIEIREGGELVMKNGACAQAVLPILHDPALWTRAGVEDLHNLSLWLLFMDFKWVRK
jgi:hypothetical protein